MKGGSSALAERVTSGQLCACGCGQETYLWNRTNSRLGWKRGEPQKYINGHNAKGRTLSEETKRRVGASHFGEKSVTWKGDDADYNTIHRWLRKHFPKTGRCEHCGLDKKTDWANRSGDYRRDRDDYLELCRSCHVKYDGIGFQSKVAA